MQNHNFFFLSPELNQRAVVSDRGLALYTAVWERGGATPASQCVSGERRIFSFPRCCKSVSLGFLLLRKAEKLPLSIDERHCVILDSRYGCSIVRQCSAINFSTLGDLWKQAARDYQPVSCRVILPRKNTSTYFCLICSAKLNFLGEYDVTFFLNHNNELSESFCFWRSASSYWHRWKGKRARDGRRGGGLRGLAVMCLWSRWLPVPVPLYCWSPRGRNTYIYCHAAKVCVIITFFLLSNFFGILVTFFKFWLFRVLTFLEFSDFLTLAFWNSLTYLVLRVFLILWLFGILFFLL